MDFTLDLNPLSDDKNEIIEDCLPNMEEEEGDTAVYSSYIEAAEKSISKRSYLRRKNFTVWDESNIKRLQEVDINQVKKDFFEYIQHKAEVTFEKLDQCVGMELREYLNVERKDEFNEFSLKLVNLTNVTKNYLDKLVKALEDGLVDVHVNNDTSMKRKSSEISKTSYRRGTKRIVTIDGLAKNDLWQCEACGQYNSASSLVCQDINCRQYFD
ncbi:E3 ubiquitin-protein ligase [Sesbania bispinosa]|nr:E3 ubiquitin-protein ligase [Sesbania bispinosa]